MEILVLQPELLLHRIGVLFVTAPVFFQKTIVDIHDLLGYYIEFIRLTPFLLGFFKIIYHGIIALSSQYALFLFETVQYHKSLCALKEPSFGLLTGFLDAVGHDDAFHLLNGLLLKAGFPCGFH